MARKRPRAASFLFEPTRFRMDPAVLAMSPAARGAYVMLFLSGWELHEVGVYPDDDRVLAAMSMVTTEEWARLRPEVARAFDVTTMPGHWVQRGLVETKSSQDRFVRAQIERGKLGGKASVRNRLSSGGSPKGGSSASQANGALNPTSVLGSRFSERTKGFSERSSGISRRPAKNPPTRLL